MEIKWNERYSANTFFYGTEPNDFLKECAGLIKKGGRVLAIGDGEGRNGVYLAQQGLQVTALDGSLVGLQKLEGLARQRKVKVETLCVDLNNYHIEPNSWDAIVSIWCHLPEALRSRVHRECVAGLKKDGLFILESYTPDQLKYNTGGPKDLSMLMTKQLALSELSGLNFMKCEEFERDVQEGQGHGGLSAVLQVIAKK